MVRSEWSGGWRGLVSRASGGPGQNSEGIYGAAARTGKVLLVDGIHDLGGMQGFGAVGYSPAGPVFRYQWEAVARALLVVVAGRGGASGGEVRLSLSRMGTGRYLSSRQSWHWLPIAG